MRTPTAATVLPQKDKTVTESLPRRRASARSGDILDPDMTDTSAISNQSLLSLMNEIGLKNGFEITESATTCTECITRCTEPSCPAAEITSECTDQCVVIACNDPAHVEMACDGGSGNPHCDFSCGDSTNETDCDEIKEFLQCCTDYHPCFSDSKSHPSQSPHSSFTWDSFDPLLCACTGQDQCDFATQFQTTDNESQPPSDMDSSLTSAASSPSFSSAIPHLHAGFQQTLLPQQDASQRSLSFADSPPSMMACMWGSCNQSFTSYPEIVKHVNLEHLRLPSAPSLPPVVINRSPIHPEDDASLACLWRDCNLYPSPDTIPGPSSDVSSAYNVLASHLLQDHLGIASTHPQQSFKLHTSTDSDGEFNPNLSGLRNPIHSSSPPPHHECSSMHVCHWQSCGQTFDSCNELTSHITTTHVGAGKAHYECYWEGCSRRGTHGFISKQKICRHLQSHTGHRPFQCKVCQQHFSEVATLQQHMRRHTQEKPYACDHPGCGKSFAITGALTIHKRTHNGDKPFKCTFCDRAFAESSNLSKHLRTHTGARPYSCSEPSCNKSFARPDQLTRHMSVHRKKAFG